MKTKSETKDMMLLQHIKSCIEQNNYNMPKVANNSYSVIILLE